MESGIADVSMSQALTTRPRTSPRGHRGPGPAKPPAGAARPSPRQPREAVHARAPGYLLAALSEVPRSALVVEDRYSAIFKLDRVRPAVVAEGLAEAQVRFPEVPIVFCETRTLAQEWSYRFLGAALEHHLSDAPAGGLIEMLPAARPLDPAPASNAEIRAWALQQGINVAAKGRLRPEVITAFQDAHQST